MAIKGTKISHNKLDLEAVVRVKINEITHPKHTTVVVSFVISSFFLFNRAIRQAAKGITVIFLAESNIT